VGLIKTEEIQQKHSILGAREEVTDKAISETRDQLKLGRTLFELGYTDKEKQTGKYLYDFEVEQKLKKLNPNLRFEAHPDPNRTDKKCLYVQRPNGLEYLFAYERGKIPEYSIFRRVVKEELDHAAFSNPKFVVERADLPDYEVIPPSFDQQGNILSVGDVIFNPEQSGPGMLRYDMAWDMQIMGWQTMLIRLVHAKVLTLHQVEKEFGSRNNPAWAWEMGKLRSSNLAKMFS